LKFYPLVSVIIPTHNRRDKLLRLIRSIKKNEYPQDKIEIVVVDDASTDGTLEAVREQFSGIRILRNKVELFPSASRNLGVTNSQGECIFLVDDDNVLDRNTISELAEVLTKYDEVGMAGPVAFYHKHPRKIWAAGGRFNRPTFAPKSIWQGSVSHNLERRIIECDFVPNAFMIKREITEFVGLFDERLPIGFEDADFALRIRKKGYKIVVSTTAKIFHDVPTDQDFHITENRAYLRGRSRIIFYKKHAPIRCFFLFVDVLGFTILVLKVKEDVKKILRYIKGIIDVLAFPLYSQM
jgi:GT2 family glycosyltransferase